MSENLVSRANFLRALLFTPPALLSGAPGGITLVKNGSSPYRIALSPQAGPSERRAADELQRFLGEMSGARLPVLAGVPELDGPLIIVGAGPLSERRGFQAPAGENSRIATVGGDLIIAGGRQRGTMYGVYAFLDKLGCRWFAKDVSRVPRRRTITLAALDEIHAPGFEYREPFFTEAFDKDWAARNRTNGEHSLLDASTGGKVSYYPFVHSFLELIPPEKYFKEHPEYFSLVGGRRRDTKGQLCLTNTAVARLAVERVREWIRLHPEATIFSVSQNDWEGWCECDNCRRVEEEEGGAHSGPLLRFVNTVAEQIEKSNPDKLIDTLAYWYTETPPAKVRPRPNVRIRLCPIGVCEAHPYENCDRSAYFIQNLKRWAAITNQIYIWHYNTNFSHYLIPFPDYDELLADIPLYKRNGVVGLFMQGAYARGGGGEDAELRSYVMARLLWNPAVDAREDIREFHEAYYGPAAKTMLAWFDLKHREVRRGQHMWVFEHTTAGYLPPDLLVDGRKLMNKALGEAATEPQRQRIRKAMLSIDYVETRRAQEFFVDGGVYGPRDPEGLKKRFAALVANARSFGMERLSEWITIEDDEKRFTQATKPVALVTLEDANVRIDVAPDLTARVIRMIDKRTGTDVLRRPDSGERTYPDTAGIATLLQPDYVGAGITVRWTLAQRSAARLDFTGTAENGLQLRRSLTLEDSKLRTATECENTGTAPVHAVLQSRADFAPPNRESDIGIAYKQRNGEMFEKIFFKPGLETSGNVFQYGLERPDSEWRALHGSSGLALVNGFPNAQAGRTQSAYTIRWQSSVTLAVWSPETTLLPGEKLVLESDFWVERR
jgi:hypothetical protein